VSVYSAPVKDHKGNPADSGHFSRQVCKRGGAGILLSAYRQIFGYSPLKIQCRAIILDMNPPTPCLHPCLGSAQHHSDLESLQYHQTTMLHQCSAPMALREREREIHLRLYGHRLNQLILHQYIQLSTMAYMYSSVISWGIL